MFDRFSAGSSARRNLLWAAAILLVVGAGYWWYQGGDAARSSAKGPPGGMTPPVPVKVETAKVQELDIFLRGLEPGAGRGVSLLDEHDVARLAEAIAEL